jgi:DNA repair protein RecO (recombination protein O)
MLCTTQAIVLRSIPYGETSIIFDVFSPEEGFLSCIVHGARKAKARVPANLLRPMTMIELVIYLGKENKLAKVKEVRLAYPFQTLSFDVRKGAVGFFLIEVAQKCLRNSAPNLELYNLIEFTLKFLDETNELLHNISLWFLVQLGHKLGVFPNLEQCLDERAYFDYQDAQNVQEHPTHPFFFHPEEVLLCHNFSNESLNVVIHLKMTAEQRRFLLKSLLRFFQFNINGFNELKSLAILHQIFS